jgi:acyl carrier protein
MENVEEKIKDYIVKEFKPEIPLDNHSRLIQEGIIDSLAIFMLIGFIEEQFGIKVDSEDVEVSNFETINAIRDLIIAKQSLKPPP